MDSAVVRSRPVMMLIAGALLINLVFGAAFITLHRIKDLHGAAVDPPAHPLTDEQSKDQVMTTARQFVAAGRLRGTTASYLLMPCREDGDPLYQGSLYMNFDLPTILETPALFREIARNLSAGGWREGVPPGHHPGGKVLGKDGMAAVYYRHPDVLGRGVVQIYGECRNVADHSMDTTGFVDVSRELSAGRR
ncbi:MAG: hypothetical protein ACOYBX_00025 [Mycobacterium sp.]